MAEKPVAGVALSWDIWCAKHLEPLRDEWPKGGMQAMLGLFNVGCRHPEIIRACGGDPDDPTKLADANKLTEALAKKSPICCLVGDEVMHLVIGYAKEGKTYNGEDGPMQPKA